MIALAGDEKAEPSLRAIAAKIRNNITERRLAPVGIHILDSDGESLQELSVNSVLFSRHGVREYESTLRKGLAAFQK